MAIFQGTAKYAKILGSAPWGYQNQYKEWSIDVTLTPDVKTKLLAEGLDPKKIKEAKDGSYEFIKFKRREVKKDGSPGQPFRVVGPDAQPWDDKTLIGNDSKINVKYVVNTRPDGTRDIGALAFQVTEHVPYEGKGDFEPIEGQEKVEESWS